MTMSRFTALERRVEKLEERYLSSETAKWREAMKPAEVEKLAFALTDAHDRGYRDAMAWRVRSQQNIIVLGLEAGQILYDHGYDQGTTRRASRPHCCPHNPHCPICARENA